MEINDFEDNQPKNTWWVKPSLKKKTLVFILGISLGFVLGLVTSELFHLIFGK